MQSSVVITQLAITTISYNKGMGNIQQNHIVNSYIGQDLDRICELK